MEKFHLKHYSPKFWHKFNMTQHILFSIQSPEDSTDMKETLCCLGQFPKTHEVSPICINYHLKQWQWNRRNHVLTGNLGELYLHWICAGKTKRRTCYWSSLGIAVWVSLLWPGYSVIPSAVQASNWNMQGHTDWKQSVTYNHKKYLCTVLNQSTFFFSIFITSEMFALLQF